MREYLRRAYRTILPLLYARTNYKLFLQRSFIDVDESIRSLMCATDILSGVVRPIPIKPPFGNSMLVVAPHQDDEIIGCGGAMLLQKSTGKNVNVVFFYDGGAEYKEHNLPREQLVRIREQEALRVAEEMGIAEPQFYRYESLHESEIAAVADRLGYEILRTKADTIFVPFFLDYNHEHRMVNFILAEALAGAPTAKKIYGYEVWGLCVANVILVIDGVMKTKQRLLSYYGSQLACTDYLNSVTGLNMYHSKSMGSGSCKYAERFFEIPVQDYINVVRRLRAVRNT